MIAHPLLDLAVTAHAWSEAEHELRKRLNVMEQRGRIGADESQELMTAALALVALRIRVLSEHAYAHLEVLAKERIPRDPNDWPTVALALVLDAGIWTHDSDFLGCGLPIWTSETLPAHLRRLMTQG